MTKKQVMQNRDLTFRTRRVWAVILAIAMFAEQSPSFYDMFPAEWHVYVFNALSFIKYLGVAGLGFASNTGKPKNQAIFREQINADLDKAIEGIKDADVQNTANSK